ncbi:MAG TPA: Flp pilus assembly protein CpaB [Candidatus Limnocylindrales bacterium]|nr:Flp pilus assembly protein CpaB [Candidatus Limnocylindrales bacterium]
MRRTSRLVLLAGVFLAALTFIVIILLLQNPGNNGGVVGQSAAPTTRTVVVAAVDIPLGTTITAAQVSTSTVPISVALNGAFQDPSQVIGQRNVVPITSGAQITSDMFQVGQQKPIPPTGMRAFAIEVNELTGVGNLVSTGDYVDVLISENVTVVQKNPDGTVSTIPGIQNALTVKMPLLLENIQVIGEIDQAAAAPASGSNGQPAASAAPTLTGASKLLILAVTPEQAEVLLFARTSGTIDVVYRAPQDTATVTTDGVILKTLIDKYGVLPPSVILAQTGQ